MKRLAFRDALGLAALCSVFACSRAADERAVEQKADSTLQSGKTTGGWYGPDGELLPSSLSFAKLPLPRGVTKLGGDGEHLQTYRTPVPVAKVQRYFAARLHATQVQAIGREGLALRQAQRLDSADAKLDVVILPSSRYGTRIELRRLPPANTPPLTPRRLERALDDLRRLD